MRYLVNQPPYKHYNIQIDWRAFDVDDEEKGENDCPIECMEPDSVPESEVLLAREHTVIWNEEQCLDIAPAQHAIPINLVFGV